MGKILEFLAGVLALTILVWIGYHAINEFGLVWNPMEHSSNICKP